MQYIDRDLWEMAKNSLGNISAPLLAHQQIQSIVAKVEQEMAQRHPPNAANANAPTEDKPA